MSKIYKCDECGYEFLEPYEIIIENNDKEICIHITASAQTLVKYLPENNHRPNMIKEKSKTIEDFHLCKDCINGYIKSNGLLL